MAKPKRPSVFTAQDYIGNQVVLYQQTWDVHICAPDNHPQMLGYENLVKSIIEDPYLVHPSTTDPKSLAFVSDQGQGPTGAGVRVLVRYDNMLFPKGASTGLVVTAYPIEPAYTRPNLGPAIYTKGKDKP